MKTNKMLRIASILLVAVMISTCAISGTFAKYVTSDNVADSAKVAKWGVTVSTTGTLFAETYKDLPVASAEDTDDKITVQVKDYASVTQNLVAPGTKNDKGMTFVLKGTPEVDTKVDVSVEITDVVLPAGSIVTSDYYPVVFTLYNKDKAAVLSTGNAATIEAYLEGLSGTYQTNTDLATIKTDTNGEYILTWEWAFEGPQTLNHVDFNAATVDKADTYLGNVAAGIVSDAPAGTSTDISISISITVTQVN